MKKLTVLVLCSLCLPLFVSAQSLGGGISFFLPETLYLDNDGTIGFEQGLGSAVKIGNMLSVPIGLVYHSSDGYRLEDTGLQSITGPALYGDILMPYAQLKLRMPLGMLYLDGWAGGAVAWAFSMKPTGNFPQLFGSGIAVQEADLIKNMGYGWMVGAALGIQIDAIGIDFGASYRSIAFPLEGSVTHSEGSHVFSRQARVLLRGISFRIGGSYSL
jgi:hypothetical protein